MAAYRQNWADHILGINEARVPELLALLYKPKEEMLGEKEELEL
jgi:hypothetical protein